MRSPCSVTTWHAAVVLANEMRPGALAAGEYLYTDNLVAGVMD